MLRLGTRTFKTCSLKYYLLLINIEMISRTACQELYKSPELLSKWSLLLKTWRYFAPRKHSSLKFGIYVISNKNQFLARPWSINKQVPFNTHCFRIFKTNFGFLKFLVFVLLQGSVDPLLHYEMRECQRANYILKQNCRQVPCRALLSKMWRRVSHPN